MSQYFPRQYAKFMLGELSAEPFALACDRIGNVLDGYARACGNTLCR